MLNIKAKNVGEAWLLASREVYENGLPIKDGEINLKESLNVFLTVEDPSAFDDFLIKHSDPSMVEWMRNNFFKLDPVLNWGYSYGQRFFEYDGINQVSNIVEKLKNNPESKSATIPLMSPRGDIHHSPCIVAIDFKIRNGKLVSTAFFRSQDAGKKLYADIICLGEIAKRIADEVGVAVGPLNILIVSLHVYEVDWEKIKHITSS